MIKVVVYESKHLDELNLRPVEVVWFNILPYNKIKTFFAEGIGRTVMADEGIIGIGGITPYWHGVGEAWIIAGPLIHKYPVAFTKAVYRGMRQIAQHMKLRRVQCLVDSTFPMSYRWAKTIGFKLEGILKEYGPEGQDFYRMVWFSKGP